jgi:hypothetical protein
LILVKARMAGHCEKDPIKGLSEMTQYMDRMCRGGSTGPLRRIRATGAFVARVMAVLTAMMLALGGAGVVRADASVVAPGIAMVICSDDGAKTIVLDADGNPVETSDDENCPGQGPCCTVPESVAVTPQAHAWAVWEPAATLAVFHAQLAGLGSASKHRPIARGPPSKEDA